MKLTTLIVLLLSLSSCNGQDNNIKNKSPQQTISETPINPKNKAPTNFLEKKYQKQGFFLPDEPNPYPNYTYFNKDEGAIKVSFIGKTKAVQDFWHIENSSGYFANKKNNMLAAQDSETILNFIDKKDYFIVSSYLPIRYIRFINGTDGEFELKDNAQTSFYLYENNRWKHLTDLKTREIPENYFSFIQDLIKNNENSVPVPNTNKEEFSSNSSATTQSFEIKNGTYRIDCSKKYPSLYIVDKEGQLSFYTQKNKWVSISISLKKKENGYGVKYNFLTGVSGKNKDLNWNDFSTDQYIAEIKSTNENKIEFKWLGFYDNSKKKIIFTNNVFGSRQKNVFITKCE